MYPLFIDKNEEFSCNISIEGADINSAIPRLLIKTSQWDLMFEGKIQGDKCIIPLKKLKSLIGEGDTGNIKLEVIVDDTLLTPWENQFQAKVSKKASVQVNENFTPTNKVKVNVNVQKDIKPVTKPSPIKVDHEAAFLKVLKENKITLKTFAPNANKVLSLFKEYLKKLNKNESKVLLESSKSFITKVITNLK